MHPVYEFPGPRHDCWKRSMAASEEMGIKSRNQETLPSPSKTHVKED